MESLPARGGGGLADFGPFEKNKIKTTASKGMQKEQKSALPESVSTYDVVTDWNKYILSNIKKGNGIKKERGEGSMIFDHEKNVP